MIHDEILIADRSALKPAFEDFAHAGSIARLRGKGLFLQYGESCHGAAWCAKDGLLQEVGETRRRLHNLQAVRFQGFNNRVAIANFSARSVDDVRAALHFPNELVIEHLLCFCVKGAINGDYIALRNKGFYIRMVDELQLFLRRFGQAMSICVMKLDVKRFQPSHTPNPICPAPIMPTSMPSRSYDL